MDAGIDYGIAMYQEHKSLAFQQDLINEYLKKHPKSHPETHDYPNGLPKKPDPISTGPLRIEPAKELNDSINF